MGLRFRRSVRLFPGVRLNFSRSGVSTSIGVRGASMTMGPRGTYANVGIPGSGLSYRTRLDAPDQRRRSTPQAAPRPSQDSPHRSPGMTAVLGTETLIHSADVSVLTSPGLDELKRLINEATLRRIELRQQRTAAQRTLAHARGRLARAQSLVIRLFTEKAIPGLVDAANVAHDALEDIEDQLQGCVVEIDFAFDDATRDSYAALVRAFQALRSAERIWDITAIASVNRFAERTVASNALARTPVAFDLAESEIVRSQYQAMRLGNVSGRDLQIYPGFVMMADARKDFALIEFSQFECQLSASNFIEEETPPADAERVGTTWKKANKDGSRDRRFNNNYHIPILRYAGLTFSSPTGLAEAYQISDFDKTAAFAHALAAHKSALSRLNNSNLESPALPAPADEAGAVDEAPNAPPAFVAKERKNLAVDWVALALIAVGLCWAGAWSSSHWRELFAAFAPPPVIASPPAQPPAPQAQPPVTHKKRRHRAVAPAPTQNLAEVAPAESLPDKPTSPASEAP